MRKNRKNGQQGKVEIYVKKTYPTMKQMFVKKRIKQNIVNQRLKQILHNIFKHINIIYTILNFLRDGKATGHDIVPLRACDRDGSGNGFWRKCVPWPVGGSAQRFAFRGMEVGTLPKKNIAADSPTARRFQRLSVIGYGL